MMALTFLVQGNTSYLPCYVVRLSPFVSILSDLMFVYLFKWKKIKKFFIRLNTSYNPKLDWDWDYMRKITIVFFCFPGESTFPGLRKFIAEKSHTRVLCFLHIAQHGLAASGCTSGGNANYLFFIFILLFCLETRIVYLDLI